MWTRSLAVLALVGSLTGCATLNTLENEVATYSQWGEARHSARYTFERLPSQQERPQAQERLENAARVALAGAGLREAADPAQADVKVQLGARISRIDRSPYDDPFWWRGGLYYSRFHHGAMWGPSLSFQFDIPRYEREVVVLIRERASGKPLYEARASNDGNSPGGDALLAAMFEAAMRDFPYAGPNPRRISVQLPG